MTSWVWREALESLSGVLPGSSGFLLDQIAGIPTAAWRRFRVDAGDVATGERLLAEIGALLGNELFVVTDASWRQDVGPFVLPAWHLSALIRDHAQTTGEPFFAEDVVIVSPDAGTVVALHRAGLLAVAPGVASPRPPIWALAHLSDSAVFADWDPPLEFLHLFGEIYPDAEVTLPSGRVLLVRWFESDASVSFAAPQGDFRISFRGPLEDLDAAYEELLAVTGLAEREAMRLASRPG